jgi:uncharacterized protein YecT (DUF1311 family)
MTRTLLPTLALTLLLAPAAAASGGQAEEDPCAPDAQRSPQLIACARRHYAEAAAELKSARASLHADLSPVSRAKLRAAERLWLRYRKTNCDAEASIYEGGTIQPLVELRCMARVTRERAAELKLQASTLRGRD